MTSNIQIRPCLCGSASWLYLAREAMFCSLISICDSEENVQVTQSQAVTLQFEPNRLPESEALCELASGVCENKLVSQWALGGSHEVTGTCSFWRSLPSPSCCPSEFRPYSPGRTLTLIKEFENCSSREPVRIYPCFLEAEQDTLFPGTRT